MTSQSQLTELEILLENSFEIHNDFLSDENYALSLLETLYLGGGTPSLWGEEGARFLSKMFEKYNIELSSMGEFTLEVNPGAWDDKGLSSFLDFGINRFSLGVQSLDSRFLKYLDRIHSLEEVHRTLSYFNKRDLRFSVDFMLGLPFSDVYKRDILFELEEILKYDPEHLSLYILTTKSNYIHKESLPNEEWIANEYKQVARYLSSRGYTHYEVSNFSKKSKESQHNLMYWKSAGVGAIGPSATGFLPQTRTRYKWKNQEAEMMLEELSEDELELEKLYMRLRTNLGMDLNSNEPYSEKLRKLSSGWEDKKWVTLSKNTLTPTSLGFLMVDSMMDDVFRP